MFKLKKKSKSLSSLLDIEYLITRKLTFYDKVYEKPDKYSKDLVSFAAGYLCFFDDYLIGNKLFGEKIHYKKFTSGQSYSFGIIQAEEDFKKMNATTVITAESLETNIKLDTL
jgi:hypothetical protein